jgi:hypothetical protein
MTNANREQPTRRIDYKVMRQTWCVISGVLGDKENTGFYIKALRKGNGVVYMHLKYNEDQPALTEETMTTMSRSFDGRW